MSPNRFVEWTHNGGQRGRHSSQLSEPLWSTHGQRQITKSSDLYDRCLEIWPSALGLKLTSISPCFQPPPGCTLVIHQKMAAKLTPSTNTGS